MVFISLLLSKNEHGILFVTTGGYELACTYNASKTRVYLLENLIKGKDIGYVEKKQTKRNYNENLSSSNSKKISCKIYDQFFSKLAIHENIGTRIIVQECAS